MAAVDTTVRAMGTAARCFVHGGADGIERRVLDRLAALESRWSRFLADSEISRLNASAGVRRVLTPETFELVRLAVEASQRTRGWFDPLLLNELEATGYDRPWTAFDPVAVPLVVTEHPRRGVLTHDWPAATARLELDIEARAVTVPNGSAFDPGGIGKGLAADMLVAEAVADGASAVLVSLGGDICCGGVGPEGGWLVAVENPFDVDGAPLLHVTVPWGAVATSTTARRRWAVDDRVDHHLIDPRTGRPSESGVVAVTAVAGQCWLAETVAKAALLAGVDEGLDILDANGVEAVMVDEAGELHFTERMPEWVT